MQIMVEMPDSSYVLGGDPDVLERDVADQRDVLRELVGERFDDIDERRARALTILRSSRFRRWRSHEAESSECDSSPADANRPDALPLSGKL